MRLLQYTFGIFQCLVVAPSLSFFLKFSILTASSHISAIAFQVVNEPADVQCPVAEMLTRSKLSCLSWNKYTKSHIASSDYEGIVTVWDVTTRQVLYM